jgi:hypothetical protein
MRRPGMGMGLGMGMGMGGRGGLPSGAMTLQTRYQQSIGDLINKKDDQHPHHHEERRAGAGGPGGSGSSSAAGSGNRGAGPAGGAAASSAARGGAGASSDAASGAAAAHAQAVLAASLGEEVAYATFRTGLRRIVDDFMASFSADADKKAAQQIGALAASDKGKLAHAAFYVAKQAAATESAKERKTLAALANALRSGSKKNPAPASDAEVVSGVEKAVADVDAAAAAEAAANAGVAEDKAEDKAAKARAYLYHFVEEAVKAKGGLPESALAGATAALFAEKPQLAKDIDVSALAADAGAVGSWGDSDAAAAAAAAAPAKAPAAAAPAKAPAAAAAAPAPAAAAAASASSTGTDGESLPPIGEVAAALVASKSGAALAAAAKDAFAKYSKVEAAAALMTEILKVSEREKREGAEEGGRFSMRVRTPRPQSRAAELSVRRRRCSSTSPSSSYVVVVLCVCVLAVEAPSPRACFPR